METNQKEIPTNTNNTSLEDQNGNFYNYNTQSLATDNTTKIPLLFVSNISEFTQFHQEISETILKVTSLSQTK